MASYGKIRAWLSDYGYMLYGMLQMIIHREPPKHYLAHRVEGKAPVILIPGILNRWSFMKNLADKISLQGHPMYIIRELDYNIHSIPESAKRLRALIEKENIFGAVLVAHSKGGLIGKYCLAHYNADTRVSGMVAIATPFSGSAIAKLIPHDSFKELQEDSDLIHDLEEKDEVNGRIISVIPEYDNHIWAKQGSLLSGAVENIELPIRGHHKVLYDGTVLQTVLSSIEKLQNRVTAL